MVSKLRRMRPEKKVLAFLAKQPAHMLFISEVSLAEIRFGIELTTDPIQRAELTDWLTNKLRTRQGIAELGFVEELSGIPWERWAA